MPLRDGLLAALVATIWGSSFVITKLALADLAPAPLALLRFALSALPVLCVAPPKLPARRIAAVGLTWFAGQFMALFAAIAAGLPPGLAAVTQQLQAFFTVLLAALLLGERPSRRQTLGLCVAFGGLALIGATVGADLPALAFGLAILAPFSWATGNLLVKTTAPVALLPLVAWGSLAAVVPAALLAVAEDGLAGTIDAVAHASWFTLATALYLSAVATVMAYALWGWLLRRHAAVTVAPFGLLAPCTGIVTAALVLGETIAPLRGAGMALILGGLAIVVLPARRRAPS